MSQILNRIFKVSFKLTIAILLLGYENCAAQYTVKRTVKDGMSIAETSEYYTYNRLNDEYNALSFKLNMSGKTGSKVNVFKLDLVYTTTLPRIPQQIVFRSANDSTLSIGSNLTPNGTKAIDNKKFTSNLYSVDVTDSLKIFFGHRQIKQVSLLDAQGQLICRLNINEPSFLIQQFTILQAPPKRKLPIKKPHKHSS